MRTGRSFAYPQTFEDADAEIKRLLGEKRVSATERRRETRAVSADMTHRRGDASAVRGEELAGYGSSAGWSKKVEDDEEERPRGWSTSRSW